MTEHLDEVCGREFCWPIGRTRIAEFECRIWRRRPPKKDEGIPTIIEDGTSFEESISKAIARLKTLSERLD